MRCQREGCDEEVLYGVQVMSVRGYRVGLCRNCAVEELIGIGVEDAMDLVDSVYSRIIIEADWWKPHFYYDKIDKKTFDRLQKEELAKLSLMVGMEKAKKLMKTLS